jgi:septal ring factor EnvC (AmiA/AmiB activator)
MASQLQQKLAAFRNNQMKLQTKAAEEVRRRAAAAERAKVRKAAEPARKPGEQSRNGFLGATSAT